MYVSPMPQIFSIPKVEHDQPCSTLVVLFFKISLFIYVILGADWSMAKNNINKQTNLKNNNNQSWAWLIMLNFGNVKNLGQWSADFESRLKPSSVLVYIICKMCWVKFCYNVLCIDWNTLCYQIVHQTEQTEIAVAIIWTFAKKQYWYNLFFTRKALFC